MKTKTKVFLIGGGIIFLILLFGLTYLSGKHNQKVKDTLITQLTNENQNFAIIHTGDNEIISRQEQRIVDLEIAEKANLIDLKVLRAKGVKDIQTVIDLKTEIARLKLEASYNTPPEVIHDTIKVNGISTIKDYLRVPLAWNFSDKWLKIDGIVKTTGVTIDSLFSYSEPSIVLGYSTGFLKKSKPIIVFSDKNPYNIVRDMSNVVIYKKPPFYKRPGFYVLEGVGVTILGSWVIKQVKW
jgi:hypothetical protein